VRGAQAHFTAPLQEETIRSPQRRTRIETTAKYLDIDSKCNQFAVRRGPNEQFCTDFAGQWAHPFPIKATVQGDTGPETRRGERGVSCVTHDAIAITRRNVCGRLGKRAIQFTARFICPWPCRGSRSPVRTRQQMLPVPPIRRYRPFPKSAWSRRRPWPASFAEPDEPARSRVHGTPPSLRRHSPAA
jgi:hypothetical protein